MMRASSRAAARLAALATTVAVALASAGVRADAAGEARFFDELARRAFAERRHADALRMFLLSHAAAPSPGTLYNIGVVAMASGEPALAYTHLAEYVAVARGDDARRADATRRLAALSPRLATVSVTSDPPGATIVIDRAELGTFGRAPRTLVVEPGPHEVTLSLADHESVRIPIDATRGTTTTAHAALPRLRGTLAVSARPEHATVEVLQDGPVVARAPAWVAGCTEPCRTIALPVGRYLVRVQAPGFVRSEREAVVRAGATEHVHVVAREAPVPVGRLLVHTGPVSARLFVDGRARATTPAAIDVPAGARRVRVEARGFVPWEGTVEVRAGRSRLLDLGPRASRGLRRYPSSTRGR
ncbi:MAG: PEGA domain-containing protein [Deltaproteobacteria bacterium]|nr:PEGA domain-containing protein [Deltaproteobacteria bacterium]